MSLNKALLIFGLLALDLPCAISRPITWNLVDVVFQDGGTASGYFVYDPSLSLMTTVDIVTSPWAAEPFGETYPASDPEAPMHCCGFGFVPDSTLTNFLGTPILTIGTLYSDPGSGYLTDSGGTFAIQGFEGSCFDSTCSSAEVLRLIASGSISSVPEPATGALSSIAAALICMVLLLKYWTNSFHMRFKSVMSVTTATQPSTLPSEPILPSCPTAPLLREVECAPSPRALLAEGHLGLSQHSAQKIVEIVSNTARER
jgi:hypothetical protein